MTSHSAWRILTNNGRLAANRTYGMDRFEVGFDSIQWVGGSMRRFVSLFAAVLCLATVTLGTAASGAPSPPPNSSGTPPQTAVNRPPGTAPCPTPAGKTSDPRAACQSNAQSTSPSGPGAAAEADLSLPPGLSPCPAKPGAVANTDASCASGSGATATNSEPSPLQVSLPPGGSPCPSTTKKPSSPYASCPASSSAPSPGLRGELWVTAPDSCSYRSVPLNS